MVFITMSSVGLPGLNGFLGELLVLVGMYDFRRLAGAGPLLASLGAGGVVLGAWYMLTMLRRVFFGPLKEPHHEGHGLIADLNGRELAALVPIAVLVPGAGRLSASRSSTRCGRRFRWWPASPIRPANAPRPRPTDRRVSSQDVSRKPRVAVTEKK